MAIALSQVDISLLSDVGVLTENSHELTSNGALPLLGPERRSTVNHPTSSPVTHISSPSTSTKLPKAPFTAHFKFNPIPCPDTVLMGLNGSRGRRTKVVGEEAPPSPLLKVTPSLRSDKNGRLLRGEQVPGRDLEKEQQLIAYLASYEKEQLAFSSTYIWCDVLIQKVLNETSAQPRPNPLRTATCCMLLNRIASLFTRYEKFIYTLAEELYMSLYTSWPESPPDPKQGSSYSIMAFLDHTTFYSKIHNDHQEETNQKMTLVRERLLHLVPKLMHRVQTPLEDLVKRATFQEWRAFVVSKRKTTSIEKQLQEHEEQQKRGVLSQCFRSWRQVIQHDKEMRMLANELALQKEEVKWMQRRLESLDGKVLQLEKDNQELRRNASAMARTMQDLSGTIAKYQASLSEISADTTVDHHVLAPELAAQLQQICEKGVLEVPEPEEDLYVEEDPALLATDNELQVTLNKVQSQVTSILQPGAPFAKDLDKALTAMKPQRKLVHLTSKRGSPASIAPNSKPASPAAPTLAEDGEDEDDILHAPTVQHLLVWINLRLQLYPHDCPKYVVSLTTDFRDSVKLACLIDSIAKEEAGDIIERVKSVRPDRPLERASLIISKAEELLGEDLSDTMKPSDIVKGRGSQMAKFFLRLYDYSGGEDIDVMANHGRLREILSALKKSSFNFGFFFSDAAANRPLRNPPILQQNQRLARKALRRRDMRAISDLAPLATSPVSPEDDILNPISPVAAFTPPPPAPNISPQFAEAPKLHAPFKKVSPGLSKGPEKPHTMIKADGLGNTAMSLPG